MAETCPDCSDHPAPGGVSRRGLLGAAGATAALLALPEAKLSFAGTETGAAKSGTLISVFLRGAADGLSLVPPIADAAYYKLRPTIAVPASAALPLDRSFGLHPSMRALHPYFKSGKLAVVHAVGDPKGTRSHFEMQDLVERMQQLDAPARSGWIAEWLRTRRGGPGRFPSVAIGAHEPTSLQGGPPSVAFSSIDAFTLLGNGTPAVRAKTARALARMHAHARKDIAEPATLALEISKRLEPYQHKTYVPSHGAVYPQNGLSFALSQLAILIRADVGLSAAALDVGGWDTHTTMGKATAPNGTMSQLAEMLSTSLAAFAQDLGPLLGKVTLLTMTEFGRTAAENGSVGTDHGVASSMFILGRTPSQFRGGQVHAKWPGLAAAIKDPNADLQVTTDYRTVLAAASAAVG